MQKTQTILALLATLTLAACSSVSQKDCDSAGLFQKGLDDGKSGKAANRFEDLQRSCSKVGVNATSDSYTYGRKTGLAEYCSESRARSDSKDASPKEVCMQEQIPLYQRAYETAKAERDQETRDKIQDLQKKQEELKRKEDEAAKKLNP